MPRKIAKPKFPSGLFYAREFRGISQDELSRKTGVLKGTISKLERLPKGGGRKLTRDWAEKFSPALDLPAQQIMFWDPKKPPLDQDVRSEDVAATLDKSPGPTVKLRGYVGAGDKAHIYQVADDAFEEVPAPPGATDRTFALEIRGKSWGPIMDTWLVFYDDVRSPVTPDLIGKACVVGLADDQILLKQIRSNGRGGFDLHPNSTTENVIHDAEIEWAAKVVGMRPR